MVRCHPSDDQHPPGHSPNETRRRRASSSAKSQTRKCRALLPAEDGDLELVTGCSRSSTRSRNSNHWPLLLAAGEFGEVRDALGAITSSQD